MSNETKNIRTNSRQFSHTPQRICGYFRVILAKDRSPNYGSKNGVCLACGATTILDFFDIHFTMFGYPFQHAARHLFSHPRAEHYKPTIYKASVYMYRDLGSVLGGGFAWRWVNAVRNSFRFGPRMCFGEKLISMRSHEASLT